MGGTSGVEAQALIRSPSSAVSRVWSGDTVYLREGGGKLITLALCVRGNAGLTLDLGGGIGMSLFPGSELSSLPLEGHG